MLIAHSREDEMIDIRHARELLEAAWEPKELLEIAGGHNETVTASWPEYERALRRFLTRHVPPGHP